MRDFISTISQVLFPFTPFLLIFCLLHTFKRFQKEDLSYLWLLFLSGILLILTLAGALYWFA